MLGKKFEQMTIWYIFHIFFQKIGFDIRRRQFAWNIKAYFLEKIRKKINLLPKSSKGSVHVIIHAKIRGCL